MLVTVNFYCCGFHKHDAMHLGPVHEQCADGCVSCLVSPEANLMCLASLCGEGCVCATSIYIAIAKKGYVQASLALKVSRPPFCRSMSYEHAKTVYLPITAHHDFAQQSLSASVS